MEQKHPIAIHFGVGVRNFKGAGLEKRSHILLILLCDGLSDQELTNETAILSEAKVLLSDSCSQNKIHSFDTDTYEFGTHKPNKS